jgi:hypothetical protein
LWKLRDLAPEFFQPLEPIRSYTGLALQFVFAKPATFEDNFNTEMHRNRERFGNPAARQPELVEAQET